MSRIMIGLWICAVILLSANFSAAGEAVISDFCKEFTLAEIPVGEFDHPRMPMSEMRITQKYNNTYSEGWCQVGNAQLSGDNPACKGRKVYYGHDGLDLHPLGTQGGQNEVYAIQDGLVIASHDSGTFTGWGETMILATRMNRYSEEIITFHFHHLFRHPGTNLTSRRYNPCEGVPFGEPIALEGGTPDWPTHLHLSVKHWKNLTDLQNAIKNKGVLLGSGYVYNNSSLLSPHYLDPEGLLFDQFNEFTIDKDNYSTWQWSESYVRAARWKGWHFGEYDGSFGVDKTVTRRDAARLIKTAAMINTIGAGSSGAGAGSLFYDVPATDSDFPYINTLSHHPADLPVINPDATCTGYGHYFCPDREVTRAEAIKMIVAAFFSRDFLEMYDNWLWQSAAPVASNLLSYFTDVSPYTWYAPYVYLAWQKGLIDGSTKKFHPGDTVKRAELAKWLVMSRQMLDGLPSNTFCQKTSCIAGYYCDEKWKACRIIPTCVSQEGEVCPLGGGYLLPGSDAGYSPSPDAGYSSDAAYTDTGSATDGSGTAATQPCSPKGSSQMQICSDGITVSTRMCMSTGYWSNWNPPCPSSSQDAGQDPDTGTDASTGTGGSGGTSGYDSGMPDAGSSGGFGGSTGNGGSGGSGGSGASPSCTTVYKISPSSGASCNTNTQASGSPTLCLELKSMTGSQTSWRLCKQSSSFQNTFSYQLLDQNHLPHNFGGPYTGASGTSCTSWRSVDFGYLTQNGSINGAGLTVEVHSPTGCTSQACTYYTGLMTVYRACE